VDDQLQGIISVLPDLFVTQECRTSLVVTASTTWWKVEINANPARREENTERGMIIVVLIVEQLRMNDNEIWLKFASCFLWKFYDQQSRWKWLMNYLLFDRFNSCFPRSLLLLAASPSPSQLGAILRVLFASSYGGQLRRARTRSGWYNRRQVDCNLVRFIQAGQQRANKSCLLFLDQTIIDEKISVNRHL
jgi:hypothetical protein